MKNIYFVGMPGSGKSTLGRHIAAKLHRDFLDTDEEIAQQVGLTPEQIITLQGEEKFRRMEKNLLEKLLNMSGLVVSTGGGFPVFNENMKYLNDHGITVYLRYNVKTLWSRLHNDRIRPLSSSAESTAELLASRESIYRKAQIIIDGESNLDQNILLTLNAIRDRYPEEI